MRPPAILCLILFLFVRVTGAQTALGLTDLKPVNMEAAVAKENGVVVELEVAEGQEVKAGEIIAKLDHDKQLHDWKVATVRADDKSATRIAMGEIKKDQADLDNVKSRNRRSWADDTAVQKAEGELEVSKGKLEQAEMFAELAKLGLELAEKMLDNRYIRSPMAGNVISVVKGPGDKAAAGDTVVVVGDLSEIQADIPIDPKGGPLEIGRMLPVRNGGRITQIGRVVDVLPKPGSKTNEKMARVVFSNISTATTLDALNYEVLLPPADSEDDEKKKEEESEEAPSSKKGR